MKFPAILWIGVNKLMPYNQYSCVLTITYIFDSRDVGGLKYIGASYWIKITLAYLREVLSL